MACTHSGVIPASVSVRHKTQSFTTTVSSLCVCLKGILNKRQVVVGLRRSLCPGEWTIKLQYNTMTQRRLCAVGKCFNVDSVSKRYICAGGITDSNGGTCESTTLCYLYDSSSDNWTQVASMNVNRISFHLMNIAGNARNVGRSNTRTHSQQLQDEFTPSAVMRTKTISLRSSSTTTCKVTGPGTTSISLSPPHATPAL